MANNTKNQGKNKKPSAGNPDKNSFKDNIQSALLFLGILVLCFSIFALMIKMDVGSFGSTVLAPMIGNISGLNAILPEEPSTDTATVADASNTSEATTDTTTSTDIANTAAEQPDAQAATEAATASTSNDTTGKATDQTTSTSNTNTSTEANATTPTDSSATNDSNSVELTLDELATYDGKDGGPAYVAVNGTIYDVTFSSAWNEGAHQGLTAGKDLTKELGSSPHGDSVLSKLPVVGTLKN